MKTSAMVLVTALLLACEGPTGPAGVNGIDGTDGVAGADGQDGQDGQDGLDGQDGQDGQDGHDFGYIELDDAGVVGFVSDTSGELVSGGTIYFVNADEVAALPSTTVEVDSTNDEPLEDLISSMGSSFPSATVDEEGSYNLTDLADGSWFITYVPADDDAGHLPGGSLCRVALDTGDLLGTQQDIEVSAAIPEGASFVGNGACVSCHGKTEIAHTMHRNGIWSPYEQGPLQTTLEKPELWEALDGKFEAGTTVYFYDYDSTRGFDKYYTSETDPGSGVRFTATATVIGGQYAVVLRNMVTPSDPDRIVYVNSVYGGGIYKQRYLVRIEGAGGDYLAMSPLQYQHEGDDIDVYDRTRLTWRDYHGDYWFSESTGLLTEPTPSKSFEKNCISCHANGVQVTGSDDTVWTANTVTDWEWGDFDYNGDGYADDLNMGCENCHGPGSEHWASTGQGKYIVSPSLLTPSREAMICGQCHSRPKGALGSDNPVNSDGWMMVAGTSRNDFLTNYATTQLDGADSNYYTDDAEHSKSHHQQYSDFIRSGKYKNDSFLMVCSDCHDPHAREYTHQLMAERDDNSGLCGTCHTDTDADLAGHIDANVGSGLGSLMDDALCSECHMTKTAKSGAGAEGITVDGTQYWMGDISSHLFDVPDKSNSSSLSMPTPYVDSCGQGCHTSL